METPAFREGDVTNSVSYTNSFTKCDITQSGKYYPIYKLKHEGILSNHDIGINFLSQLPNLRGLRCLRYN
jgi:hypothetical protein